MPVHIVYNHFPQAAAAVLSNADDLSKDIATVMKNEAERRVPVLFGFLKASIHLEGEGSTEVSVVAASLEGGAPREYAAYVEYGTRHTPAQPFMLPGFIAGLASVPAKGREYGAKIEAAV